MAQNSLLPSAVNYRIHRRQSYTRLVSDGFVALLSYLIAAQLVGRHLRQVDLLVVGGLCMTWYFTSKASKLYDDFRTVTFVDEILALIPNVIVQFLVISVSLFFLNDDMKARLFAVVYVGAMSIILTLKMYSSRKILRYFQANGLNQQNLVIVGETEQVDSLKTLIEGNPQFGYQIAGLWAYKLTDRLPLTETLNYLRALIQLQPIDELVIVQGQFEENYVRGLINWADTKGILVRFTPGFFQFSASRYSLELFGNFPLITVRSTPLEMDYWWMVKRAFDVIFSVAFLVLVASWLFPIIAIAIWLDSKGPVFFIQERWGMKGRNIGVWKFRTMHHNASTVKDKGGFQQTTQNDARVTKVGKFLRRTNLDELPQFINVFLGSMSVVGPRPHAVKHSLETLPHISNYMIRHRIKPGITGWAQVSGFRGETHEIGLMRKRVDYDIWYIENWSLVLDMQIVIRTVYNMLKGDPMAY